MKTKSSNSQNGQILDAPTKPKKKSNNNEFSIFAKIFRFLVRGYIKILKYTVLAIIEIFKEILRIPFGKKSKKS
ncbi:hypothetical protein [Mongoliibacter ruber]|uniref:Uncharacterized protein n=1 Tax=Mongoliibacter ruber TaxID=1750599 RepID=A0A2T0WGD6_9BACT|nr:hypothetical protein [Mongoliibacter ruber]PRY85768.1 hypothetical protein CLW00_111111 [Mongoliibacter ruber]